MKRIPYRVRAQVAEILGDDNRWYCSQFHEEEVTDPDKLAEYFCQQGGADDFARRWTEAMDQTNRYYCSLHHHRPIHDEETLWEYYLEQMRQLCE